MNNLYVHTILNLLSVMILMLVVMYLLKKFKVSKFANNKHIKIINTVPIGAKERVILLEVNNTVLLVGATPNHIETLYVFNELDTEKEFSKDTVVPGKSFAEQAALLG